MGKASKGGPRFPIVGIGASAGGLEAFTQLLKALPADTGMAFVLIQHLDAAHESLLSQALAKTTAMPVCEAKGGMMVEPDHVYCMPANADLSLRGDLLELVPRADVRGTLHLPIDLFFRSLAEGRGSQAIGVVLSGNASDGTEGLRAIQGEGGFSFAQDPAFAKFSGMPQSAVAAGVADQVLQLPELAGELVRLSRHAYVSEPAERAAPAQDGAFDQTLAVIRNAGGIDFSEYKPATIERRLQRRVALRRFSTPTEYLKFLRGSPDEVHALQEDLLIHVTSFFRDPEVFEELKEHVFPELFRATPEEAPVRIWVAGCSTGEEVYSVAIALLEFLSVRPSGRVVQLFGSDVSEQAIAFARTGLYSEAAVRHLTEDQRRTWFVKVEGGFRIHKVVREMCVFVRHDLARDPPFSKLDLICCRNVLIYFAAGLQKRIVGTFHYCLGQGGHLLLGRTESLTGFSRFFTPVGKASKIFARTRLASTLRFALPQARQVLSHAAADPGAPADLRSSGADVSRAVDRLLLAQYAPPGAVVNATFEVVQFRGRTGQYLEPAAGDPQSNLLKMARPGLLAALRSAFAEARKRLKPSRKQGLIAAEDGATRHCGVLVVPLAGDRAERDPLYLVLFEDSAAPKHATRRSRKSDRPGGAKLEDELASTRDYLQSLIEEHGRTNDDLGSANEELVSSNEELQSMNEELETAKEELQSANEELITVNDELHSSNQQLHKVNTDLVNLLDTVDLPVVMLDLERRIRRFTPKARHLLNVLPSDVGRPIDDIKLNVEAADVDARVAGAIASGKIDESEVVDREGHWHRMQIRPYRSADGSIDGALVSLVDIDALKHTVRDAEWQRDYAAGIVDAVQVPLVVLDEALRARSANRAFRAAFDASATSGDAKMADWGAAWNIPELWPKLEALFTGSPDLHGFEVERSFNGQRKWLSFSGRMVDPRIGARMVLLSIEDVTERRKSDAERAKLLVVAGKARDESERANRAKDDFLSTLSHELRTPLATMLLQAQLLKSGKLDGERIARASEVVEQCVRTQARLIDDLFDTSRIVSGKLFLELGAVDLVGAIRAAADSVSALAARKQVAVALDLGEGPCWMTGDRTRLQQIVWNLLGNSIKFTPAGGSVSLRLTRSGPTASIEVRDSGAGIDAAFLPKVFTRFSQQDDSSARRYGGLGLGLAIVRHLVELHGGTVEAQSPGKNKGATFVVRLPIAVGTAAAQPSERPAVEVNLLGMPILLVDDDLHSREAVGEVLEQRGAMVRAVGSAAEARGALEVFAPAVIVSDIAMPEENGYSFIRSVREGDPKIAGVPAIALTALASKDDRQTALTAGFQEHLAKPVDTDGLVRAVVKVGRL